MEKIEWDNAPVLDVGNRMVLEAYEKKEYRMIAFLSDKGVPVRDGSFSKHAFGPVTNSFFIVGPGVYILCSNSELHAACLVVLFNEFWPQMTFWCSFPNSEDFLEAARFIAAQVEDEPVPKGEEGEWPGAIFKESPITKRVFRLKKGAKKSHARCVRCQEYFMTRTEKGEYARNGWMPTINGKAACSVLCAHQIDFGDCAEGNSPKHCANCGNAIAPQDRAIDLQTGLYLHKDGECYGSLRPKWQSRLDKAGFPADKAAV